MAFLGVKLIKDRAHVILYLTIHVHIIYGTIIKLKHQIVLDGYSLSDGCAEQYKSRHTAYEFVYLCRDLDIDKCVHTFAPTSQFKCVCDSGSNDSKVYVRKNEIAGT